MRVPALVNALLSAEDGLRYFPNSCRRADIARVYPQAIDAGVNGQQGQFVVEVDIGDEGDPDFATNLRQGAGGGLVDDGEPDDIDAVRLKFMNLRHRGLDVAGVGLGHRLDAEGGAAAHGNGADVDLPRDTAHDG